LDEPKVSVSGRRSPVEEAVVRIVELETEINISIANLMTLKQEIGKAIRSVNNMECETLLEMRYLTFLGWEQIASQLDYSQDYIYHLHRKALGLVGAPST
jgi:DNA-directed RNA polymerase specialized sigma subunit